MKRIPNSTSGIKETVVRMTGTTGRLLFDHMRADRNLEQMAFGLGVSVTTANGHAFLVRELILPDQSDLAEQSVAGVCPTREFHSYLYQAAQQSQSSIIEFHTHPGTGAPTFSGTDGFHALRNAQYITEKFSEPVTLVLIVGNNRFDAFDGAFFDRQNGEFRQLSRLEVLGRPIQVWSMPH